MILNRSPGCAGLKKINFIKSSKCAIPYTYGTPGTIDSGCIQIVRTGYTYLAIRANEKTTKRLISNNKQ